MVEKIYNIKTYYFTHYKCLVCKFLLIRVDGCLIFDIDNDVLYYDQGHISLNC